ncbi:MAG TPA: YciI family protein [Solirubrobacteraceae bacterium]|jgi:hypothetical protein|nr:YciI family protein [Solirubrobacteraceae bacterium]
MQYILFYDYVPDMAERRGPYREAHLQRIFERRRDGHVTAAGGLGDPVHGAAIVFKDTDPTAIERFAAGDPYVIAGLVVRHRIEPWRAV